MLSATAFESRLPTLEKGVYGRPPTIEGTLSAVGRLEWAIRRHWLSVPDMESLWQDTIGDQLLNQINGLPACSSYVDPMLRRLYFSRGVFLYSQAAA